MNIIREYVLSDGPISAILMPEEAVILNVGTTEDGRIMLFCEHEHSTSHFSSPRKFHVRKSNEPYEQIEGERYIGTVMNLDGMVDPSFSTMHVFQSKYHD